MEPHEVRKIRRERWAVGALQRVAEAIADDALIRVECPSPWNSDDTVEQVVVAGDFPLYQPGGNPDSSAPKLRVAPVFTLSTEFESGTYDRPVTGAEDYESWVRGRTVEFNHEVEAWTAGQLCDALRGLPLTTPLQIETAERPGGDLSGDSLYIRQAYVGEGPEGRPQLVIVGESLPIHLAIEHMPPEGRGHDARFALDEGERYGRGMEL